MLYAVVAALAWYAWRDWFVSLCGLIVLMAFAQHADMPRAVMGVQGFNPLNVLLFCIAASWVAHRRQEGRDWGVHPHINYLLLVYLAIFLIAFGRMMLDREAMIESGYTLTHLIGGRLINTIKYVVPGLMLCDGCRTRKRLTLAMVSIGLLYVMLSVQVIKYMPWTALAETGRMSFRKQLGTEMGLGPGALGKALAGGAWGVLAAAVALKHKWWRIVGLVAFVMITFALILVGSRSAFVAWAVVGVALCVLRWRRYLPLVPIAVVCLFVAFPGPAGRLVSGFGQIGASGRVQRDEYTITSGRNVIWPYVMNEIAVAPVLGHGGDGMRRTGLTHRIRAEVGEDTAVGHAHNAYLNVLLEAGIVGLIVVLILFWTFLSRSAHLLLMRGSVVCPAVGGLAFSIILAHLVSGIGSQSFFPQECDIGMWCAIGLLLRVSCDVMPARAPRATVPVVYCRSPGVAYGAR